MAITHAEIEAELEPRWPDLGTLPERTSLDFDPVADSLLITWDRTRPAENVYVDIEGRDYVSLRLALDTQEVVGIEVEALQPLALRRHPSWQRLVDIAGVNAFKQAEVDDYSIIAAFIEEVARLPLA